jgi:hypothetical protein
MECQAIRDGELLPGPLSAFAYHVPLADVHLDHSTGEPCELDDLLTLQQGGSSVEQVRGSPARGGGVGGSGAGAAAQGPAVCQRSPGLAAAP